MHAELVEKRRWISEQRFLHALNFCMLLPGPEATQLATYIGWLLHRTRGGIAAGVLFVLPSAMLLFLLSWVYVTCGSVGWISAMFYGLKASVLGIVAVALRRLGQRTLKSASAWAVAGSGVRWFMAMEMESGGGGHRGRGGGMALANAGRMNPPDETAPGYSANYLTRSADFVLSW